MLTGNKQQIPNAKRAKLTSENNNTNQSSTLGKTKGVSHLYVDNDDNDELKRASSLPPVNTQLRKNVVQLEMKNRNLKSDNAYNVSQIIKVRKFSNFLTKKHKYLNYIINKK